jgi:hypothetical protein
MDAAALIGIYIVAAAVIQGIGFLISEAVDYEFPTAGLLTFLLLFLSAFWIAWPIAVRIFERLWGDRPRRGETEDQTTARRAGLKVDYEKELDRKI